MSKVVKEMVMAAIDSRLGDTRDLLVVDVAKLDAITTNKLRLALREKKFSLLTVRNALARRTLNNAGVTGLDKILEGPSTLVWGGEDIVALSKEISKWAKQLDKLSIKGGTTEGAALSAADVESLSKSPSREELISQLVGQILSPGANLAAALLGPGAKLGSQIKKLAEKEEQEEVQPAAT